jgi:hypothetical protein
VPVDPFVDVKLAVGDGGIVSLLRLGLGVGIDRDAHHVSHSGLLGFWASGLLGFWASGLLGSWARSGVVHEDDERDTPNPTPPNLSRARSDSL